MMNFIEKSKNAHISILRHEMAFSRGGLACPPKRTPEGYFCPAGQDVYR